MLTFWIGLHLSSSGPFSSVQSTYTLWLWGHKERCEQEVLTHCLIQPFMPNKLLAQPFMPNRLLAQPFTPNRLLAVLVDDADPFTHAYWQQQPSNHSLLALHPYWDCIFLLFSECAVPPSQGAPLVWWHGTQFRHHSIQSGGCAPGMLGNRRFKPPLIAHNFVLF